MSESVEVLGLDEIRDLLDQMPGHIFDAVDLALRRSTLNIHTKVTDNFISTGDSGGDKLHSRSGRLRRSIKTKVAGQTLSTIRGNVYTDMVYAPIQEKGGRINPIDKYLGVPGGPYLNIPLDANKTPAGVMRMNARQVFNGGGYIIKTRTGKYLVMSGQGQPMFVLSKGVTIPPRLGMMKAADDEIPTLLSTIRDEVFNGLDQ